MVGKPSRTEAATAGGAGAASGVDSLGFVLPGLVHALGNALFAVRGHVAILGQNGATPGDRQALARATDQALAVLDLLRLFDPVSAPTVDLQAGVLLSRLGGALQVPLRERGIRLECTHTSTATPTRVHGGPCVRAIVGAVSALAEAAPAAWRGRFVIDLFHQDLQQVQLRITASAQRGCLPFTVAADSRLALLAEHLAADGVQLQVRPGEQGVIVTLPVRDR